MINTQPKIACIAGATGLVGKELLQELLNGDDYQEVWAVGRRSCEIYHPKLKEWLIWSHDKISQEPDHIDTVFCCVGSTIKKAGSKQEFYRIDHDLPMQLAQIGLKKEARTYILISSKGANPGSTFFYNRVKGELERDLERLNYQKLAIFRPSILSGPRHENRFGEKLGLALMRMLAPVIPGSDRFKPTESAVLAKAMLNLSIQDFESPKVVESIEIPEIAGIENPK